MKKYIIILGLLFVLFACSEQEAALYDTAHRQLFISTEGRMDTAYISFSHHPGENTLKVPFIVTLIGEPAKVDLEYKIQVIDSLTTAIVGDYVLPQPPVFKANRMQDTLWIEVKKEKLEEKSYLLKLTLAENENFKAGYYYQQTAQLRYDNMISFPLWWDNTIVEMYLGTFSPEKYTAFIKVTDETTLEGKEPWEMRLLALELKNAIAASLADNDPDNDITEAGGAPMIIPCY